MSSLLPPTRQAMESFPAALRFRTPYAYDRGTMQLIGGSLLRYGLGIKAEVGALAKKLSAFADAASTLAALPRIV